MIPVAVVLGLGVAAAAPSGFSPPPKPAPPVRKPASTTWTPEALSGYADAMMADKAGDLETAEREYERWVNSANQPVMWFNLADVQRRMEKYRDAIKSYGKYLEAAPDAPDRGQVEKIIGDLQATPAIATIDGDDPRAVVYVDGVLVGPSPQTIVLPEGKHVIDRIGPESTQHSTEEAKPLEVSHIHAYARDKPDRDDVGNVVMSASGAITMSCGWREGDQMWTWPGRAQMAPGKHEVRMCNDNYLCDPIRFEVPRGDGVTFLYLDAGAERQRGGGCIQAKLRVQKVVFAP